MNNFISDLFNQHKKQKQEEKSANPSSENAQQDNNDETNNSYHSSQLPEITGQSVDSGSSSSQEGAELERQRLELQKRELEIAERRARLDEDYAYAEDKEKYLNPDNIIKKKGLPVMDAEGNLGGFVDPAALNYYRENHLNKPYEQLSQDQQQQLQVLQQQQYLNETVPRVTQFLQERHPYLATEKEVNVQNLIPQLQRPEVVRLLDLAAELESTNPEEAYRAERRAIVAAIEAMEYSEKYSRPEPKTYSDGTEVPTSVAGKHYEGGAPTPAYNENDKYLGKNVIIVLPDDAELGSKVMNQAMQKQSRIATYGYQKSTEDPSLMPSINIVHQREFEAERKKALEDNRFRDKDGKPLVAIDTEFLPRATA